VPGGAFNSGAGVLGLVLRHRKLLVIGYLGLLHFLVYFSLTHGVRPERYCPLRHPTHLIPRFSNQMVSFDVASKICHILPSTSSNAF
jgi:hypothetical protein